MENEPKVAKQRVHLEMEKPNMVIVVPLTFVIRDWDEK